MTKSSFFFFMTFFLTVPFITIAGGTAMGVTNAIITRLIGRSALGE
jgi:hypothetical protein